MRLFTAIDLPGELVATLARLIDQLRPSARINWSAPANLHITTKFIGEWPDNDLDRLTRALETLAPREPIPIAMRGVGFFPNPHSPRLFWAAVHAGPELAALARDTDAALAGIGVPADTKPFSPHLTLARIKAPAKMQPLREAIAALPSTEFGAFTPDTILLVPQRVEADRFRLY